MLFEFIEITNTFQMIFEELPKFYFVLLLSNLDKVTFDYLTLDISPWIFQNKESKTIRNDSSSQ